MGEPGPRRTGLTPSDLLSEWSRRHHGIDPATVPFLRFWLRMVEVAARPFAGVPPLVLTAFGPVFALVALLVVARQPWPAAVAVLLAVACDALDGAVAALAGRVSVFGARADKVADRVADSLFALTVWRCGAPLWLALLAGAGSLLHEAYREVRGGALRSTITVAERPTRVICTLLACGSAAVSSATWPATVCAAVWLGLAVVGLFQLGARARTAARQ